jgi:hypothetical protein
MVTHGIITIDSSNLKGAEVRLLYSTMNPTQSNESRNWNEPFLRVYLFRSLTKAVDLLLPFCGAGKAITTTTRRGQSVPRESHSPNHELSLPLETAGNTYSTTFQYRLLQ